MLPVDHMQPYAMPRSLTMTTTTTTLDSHAQFRHHPHHPHPLALNVHQRVQDDAFQHVGAFPIRTSQSYRRIIASSTSPYPPRSDHHLRRKTPNGTIDAAYDGSLAQPFIGPPPLKHMVLPAPSLTPTYPLHATLHPLRQVLTPISQAAASWDRFASANAPWVDKTAPFRQNGLLQHLPAAFHSYQPPAHATHGPFANTHQPVLRANEHNVRAFCPPPLPISGGFPFGQDGWQPGPLPWNQQYPGQPYDLRAASFPPNHNSTSQHIMHQAFGSAEPGYSFKPAHSSPIDFESLTLNSQSTAGADLHNSGHHFQPSRFRDKALSQAHRAYVNLLAHPQNDAQKPHQITRGNGQQSPPKQMEYPKPPNPFSLPIVRTGREDATNIHNTNYRGGIPIAQSPVNHMAPFASKTENLLNGMGHPISERNTYSGHFTESFDFERGRPQFGPQSAPIYPCFPGDAFSGGNCPPAAEARSSLDILNSLCEESGWKWIDGMLLGGCLHYGLENYDDALQWFSKVAAVDSSHVVAMTNIAATLYCLKRQDEAEQYWLRAVKHCPSYLEASEHLVGLLYKKRSQEAVEVISYVQQALELPPSEAAPTVSTAYHIPNFNGSAAASTIQCTTQITDTGWTRHTGAGCSQNDDADGFGSSGYALPGSDNGKMLALVHAKGTMLYSLKEIDQASKSFEEAVMISVGRDTHGIRHLVHRIQAVLSPVEKMATQHPVQPLLLPPEKARQTARLVFASNGELPGLRFVAEGAPKRGATQTTSNSLLSLAKIFQDTMSKGAGPCLLRHPAGVGDILALYYLSLSLQESPSTANNVGILLAGVQQVTPISVNNVTKTAFQLLVPGVPPGSGLELALAYYQYGLRLDPKHVHLHTNLGSLLKDIGQLDLAIQMYEQAVSCDGTFDIALTNLANAVKDRGRIKDAIMYYKRAVKSNPHFAEAVCGLFTALNSVCDWKGRGGVLLESGKFDRWHVGEDGSLLDSRAEQRDSGLTKHVVDIVSYQLDDASRWGCNTLQDDVIHCLVQELSNLCDSPVGQLKKWLRGWKGQPWEGSRLLRLVERASRARLQRWYYDQYILGDTSSSRYDRPRLPSALTVPSAPTVLPFHTFTCPLGPNEIRAISQRNAARISCSTLRSPWLPNTLYPPPPPPEPQLNIGYLSSDFNNHPLAHLMQSVFGFHNPRRTSAVCYATTASDKSVYREKIEQEAPVFRDVSSWSPDKLIEQIVRDKIHILVNLNGYTRGARNEIFAARPAPIQMSFMGFAGTLGAEWCDYILADTTAIPPRTLRPCRDNVAVESVFHDETNGDGADWVYSENVIFCRDTFFCCDHAQSSEASERLMTWEGEQHRRWNMRKEMFPKLSDDTVILGNFNQLYKIEPTTFRSWLRILARVPKAVLWLLRFPELGEANLRTTAEKWAGPEVASRLIFTDVAPKNQHIARARVCDLFLDTPECNAHTTAADVLWSSTPLLTLPRYPFKMCSRMAASILKGALPRSKEGQQAASELIAGDENEYEQAATELARGLTYSMSGSRYGEGRGRLAEIRKLLFESKWHCALFDTRRWVDDVETAYEEAWRKWVAGEGGDIYL